MKKLLLFLTAIMFVILVSAPSYVAQAETVSLKDPYSLFVDYATKFTDRTPGSVGESNAAAYISAALATIKSDDGVTYKSKKGDSDFIVTFNTVISDAEALGGEREIVSRNVIAYKRSQVANAKLLVISCEYGNAYSVKDEYGSAIKSEGAYEFSTSVATLLNIAYQLRNSELSFDVAFAFFGAGCYESKGVINFLDTNEQALLGAIDLYAVGGGKDLYVYYDEIETEHGKLLDGIISRFDYDVKSAPFDKKYLSLDSDAFAVRHVALSSSNYYFLGKGVPSVELFGYNWSAFGSRESDGENIIGTSADTLNYMLTNYGESKLKERMELTRSFVVNSVLRDRELATAFESYNGGYGGLTSRLVYWILLGVSLAVVIGLFVLGIVVYSRKASSAPIPTFTVSDNENAKNADRDDVFDFLEVEPTYNDRRDDPFGMNEDPFGKNDDDKNSRDDDDDIFGEL